MATMEEKNDGGELDAWELDYHEYLVNHTDIRTKFEAAEYYVLNAPPAFHEKMQHHPKRKLQLWAYRQQLYEGPCNLTQPSEVYRLTHRELVDKYEAWRKLGDMPAKEAAKSFEELVHKMEPMYAVNGSFPLGPLEQQRMILILQANIRKKKAAADVNHAKYTRKMVHRIRKVAKALIDYEDKKKASAEATAQVERNLRFMERATTGINIMYYKPNNPGRPVSRTLWLEDDVLKLHVGTSATADGLSQDASAYLNDISEIRKGPRTVVFKNAFEANREPAEVGRLCSIISSEGTIDIGFTNQAERDEFASEVEAVLVNTQSEHTQRYFAFEKELQTSTGHRRPLSLPETLDMKNWEKKMSEEGMEVVVFEGRGTTTKRMWLVKEEVAYGETERRPRIIVTDGGKKDFTGKYKYHETGIDVADICEVRPGYAASAFNHLKDVVDLQTMQHQTFAIIGSERSLCCQAIGLNEADLIADERSSEGQPTAENLARTFVRGLRLYMHTAPKHLGPMEKNDYLLDQCIDGETVWVAARRLDHLLKPKQDRDDDIEAHLLEVQEAKERGIQHIMNDLDPDEKKLSFEQTKQYKQMFKAIDVSGDGKIDGDELAEYINGSSGSVQTSSKQIASMMRLYDKDNDGEIDRDEFLEMMAQLQVVDNALASMSTVFYDFDIDGDGNITRDEFKQVMRAYPSEANFLSDEQLDDLVDLIDVDGSGDIDYHEFMALMSKALALLQ